MPKLKYAVVGTAAFLLLLVAGCKTDQKTLPVTILHWNDFHAYNLPYRMEMEGDTVLVGGAAYLAGLLDSLRAVSPRPVALHAGDEFTGTPISAITEGESQIPILNMIHPDAFTVGNHEFDYGWETLKQRITEMDFPVLCANILDKDTGKPIALSKLIIERQGVKIGIIGITTRQLSGLVMQDVIDQLLVEDPIPIVNRLIDELEPITDIQIALTHQGVDEDKRLADGCPRLDLIVGGHQHVRLFEPVVENGVPILQAGCYGQYLGIFKAEVDTRGDRIVNYTEKLLPVLTDSIRPREDIAALVAEQDKTISAELDRVVGELEEPWVRRYIGESNVGDWTADAMIRLTGRDVAFINSGGLRKNVPAGPVTLRDLWELHPFGNTLVAFDLTGAELQKIVRRFAGERGVALQVGGMRFKVKKGTGEIVELTVQGKPVHPDSIYHAVANSFVTGHAEKYFGFDLGDRPVTDLGIVERDLVKKAFEEEKTVRSVVDGRIEIVE
jgi:2',3'-cyclic-nucleotide 2'-phosphodiesterase (5'-nucleotidase family)